MENGWIPDYQFIFLISFKTPYLQIRAVNVQSKIVLSACYGMSRLKLPVNSNHCVKMHTPLYGNVSSLLLWDRCGWRYFYFPSLLMHYFTYLHPSAVNQNDNFYDLISGEQSARNTEKWFLAVK